MSAVLQPHSELLDRIVGPGQQLIIKKLRDAQLELYSRRDDGLRRYVQRAWEIVEPAVEYMHNRHIDAICEHLQAISYGDLQHLIINVPPRFMKSLLVSVMWPTWEWGPLQRPSTRWIFATYAQKLSTRDSLKCRRIIESPWYGGLYGDVFKLTSDQNEKTRFENDKTGYRIATSVDGSATGEGGDRVVVDDPHNVMDTESEASIESTTMWWDEAMSTRLNNLKTGSRVIVMQRIKDTDLTGHLLAEKSGYEHLMIPMEYEHARSKTTSIGWRDWRKVDGELAWPTRFPADVVRDLKKDLGTYAAAGQLQQDPAPRSGGMFKAHFWRYYDLPPMTMVKSMDETIASWDCTFKDGEGTDYVAGHVWGRKGVEYYLLARRFGRMTFTVTRNTVFQLASEWQQYLTATIVEDKANGPAVVNSLQSLVQGVIAVTPQGGKTARANVMVPTQEAGQIWLPNPAIPGNEWVRDEFIPIFSRFPKGATDDDVDAASQAIIWFRTRENAPSSQSEPAVGGKRTM